MAPSNQPSSVKPPKAEYHSLCSVTYTKYKSLEDKGRTAQMPAEWRDDWATTELQKNLHFDYTFPVTCTVAEAVEAKHPLT